MRTLDMRIPGLQILLLLATGLLAAQQTVTTVGSLPADVRETSGLIFYNNALITHNDSGNLPQLFELDTLTLAVVRTVTISNATNVDWEDISQDADFIYIGDFGNNLGNRQDLVVYKVSKTDFDSSNDVMAQIIRFSYEDQTDFSTNSNSNWDAEAMVSLNNQLIVFTKEWERQGTTAYILPKIPGNYSAQNAGSYDIQGLVTSATYNEITALLYLCGYSQVLQPFVARIEDATIAAPLGGSVIKANLSVGLAQIEGLAHSSAGRYFLSSEEFVNTNPPITLEASLFAFETGDIAEEEPPPIEEPPVEPPPEENPDGGANEIIGHIRLFRTFGSHLLQYEIPSEEELFGRAIYDVTGKRIQYTDARAITENAIDLSTFKSAVYYLTFYFRGRVISKPFMQY